MSNRIPPFDSAEALYHENTVVSAMHMAKLWHAANGIGGMLDIIDRSTWTPEDMPQPITPNEKACLISAMRCCNEVLENFVQKYTANDRGRPALEIVASSRKAVPHG